MHFYMPISIIQNIGIQLFLDHFCLVYDTFFIGSMNQVHTAAQIGNIELPVRIMKNLNPLSHYIVHLNFLERDLEAEVQHIHRGIRIYMQVLDRD